MKNSQLPKDIIKFYLPEFDVEEADCLKTLANAKYSAACKKKSLPSLSLYPLHSTQTLVFARVF